MSEAPTKAHRKKPEVPVHKNDLKTYGANFNSRKSKRSIDVNRNSNDVVVVDDDRETTNVKISRKYLSRENDRLARENYELTQKIQNYSEVFAKKINKLREKLNDLEAHNVEIVNENALLRDQNENFRTQLETAKNCKTCEELKKVIEKNNAEYNLVRKTNKELLEDINMLKNVVYRLNVQMERYQERLHKSAKPPMYSSQDLEHCETISEDVLNHLGSDSHANHTHTPISWGKVSCHTLGPLLDSYQETIQEKEEIIQSYEVELSNFTAKMKEVIRENENLHRRLTEDEECSSKLSEELLSLKSELQNVKDQNDLLVKKCALKQDKLEEVLKCYEQKVNQMKRDYTLVHEQYCKSRTEIAALKEKNKNLLERKGDFENNLQNYIPLSVHSSSVNECKKLYEELKLQYENEKLKLREEISSGKNQVEELNRQIVDLNKEKETLESKIRSLEKHIKKFETKYLDLQHNLNEVQLSRSACRKQLHKAMSFAKDLVAEQETLLKTLNQRQQENKMVKMYGSDIANRMDSLKNQLKTVQKEAWQELSSVEQRIQEQDTIITTMKQEHEQEVEKLKQIIKEKEEISILSPKESSIPLPHYLLFRDRNVNK